ncbi:DUF1801 domain-containing protein [Diaminobutyricimonas sp. TR449]|uniref:DUF1801 domain-containing protein n=1 Tax=Diaminobutyricimonas sp. TR449 TaxID=2708076 RepID=UPI00141E9122|nr:DUF1801 domain-containing protein [Diaminobutyricimonas sp. TR449]
MPTVDEYISALATPQRVVAGRLQDLLDEQLPTATAQLYHAHPVWMEGKTPIAGFKAYPRWVTLMLWSGKRMSDPSGRLEASAGSTDLASVKFAHVDEIDDDLVRDWLTQAAALTNR